MGYVVMYMFELLECTNLFTKKSPEQRTFARISSLRTETYLWLAWNEGMDPYGTYSSPCITHYSSFHFFIPSFPPNQRPEKPLSAGAAVCVSSWFRLNPKP